MNFDFSIPSKFSKILLYCVTSMRLSVLYVTSETIQTTKIRWFFARLLPKRTIVQTWYIQREVSARRKCIISYRIVVENQKWRETWTCGKGSTNISCFCSISWHYFSLRLMYFCQTEKQRAVLLLHVVTFPRAGKVTSWREGREESKNPWVYFIL